MKLVSRGPEQTDEIGFKIGRLLKQGDVVCLYGNLGTGKTTLVKGIARAFGISERDVSSASFTIIAEYPVQPPFYHIDLYRIQRAEDLETTGFWECLDSASVCVIEWAERAGDGLPGHIITVRLASCDSDIREIVLEGLDEKDWNNL